MDGKLFGKVIQGVKAAAGIEAFLVLAVTTLHFTVVARRVGTDELVPDTQLGGSGLKQSREIPLAVGKTVGEFKAVIRLDAFHADSSAGIPLEQLFQKIRRGIGGLLRISGQEAQTGELINGGVLKQAQFRVSDAAAGDHLHIYLDTLSGIFHLLIRLRNIFGIRKFLSQDSLFLQKTIQSWDGTFITALHKFDPKDNQTRMGIAPTHILDQLDFFRCMLIGMVMGTA